MRSGSAAEGFDVGSRPIHKFTQVENSLELSSFITVNLVDSFKFFYVMGRSGRISRLLLGSFPTKLLLCRHPAPPKTVASMPLSKLMGMLML